MNIDAEGFDFDAEKEVRMRAEKVSRDDVKNLLGREAAAERLSQKAGFFSQYWDDIKTSFSLLRDWFAGRYDRTPARLIAALAGALIYFLSPIDLLPDWIPLVGFLDDAAILAAAFKMSAADLVAYRIWKNSSTSLA